MNLIRTTADAATYVPRFLVRLVRYRAWHLLIIWVLAGLVAPVATYLALGRHDGLLIAVAVAMATNAALMQLIETRTSGLAKRASYEWRRSRLGRPRALPT